MKIVKSYAVILLVMLAAFAGCRKDDDKPGYGSMAVKMTDAPGNYLQVNVEILSVEVHHENHGWIALQTKAGVYDLLKLKNDVTAPISDTVSIATGKVTQMRLILGNNNTVLVDSLGTPMAHPLITPSAQNTGVKINIDANVTIDKHLEVVIDFDADSSIHLTGNNEYMLEPVIKVKSIKTL